MTCVAIMQPTYLPWLGYFSMIYHADTFVYLDSVQFARRSWQQRNRIKSVQGEQMLTIPVFSKGLRGQTINETMIDLSSSFGLKHWRSIETAYGKCPHFLEFSTIMRAHFLQQSPNLAEFNISIIETLCKIFDINTIRLRSSKMRTIGAKADLLSRICSDIGAEQYLSAPGSKGYIEETDAFKSAGISVKYHAFEHPTYPQGDGQFIPYMSAIDSLFRLGADETIKIIREN